MQISIMNGGLEKFKPVEINKTKDLVDIITKYPYSCGVFKDNHRKNENFQGSNYVGLDFDEGMTLEEAKFRFAKYEHIIATSPSHQKLKNGKVCDRFRVILKLEKFVDDYQDFKETVTKLMEVFPDADPKCKDSARYFKESPDIVSVRDEGELVTVYKYTKPEIKSEPGNYLKGNLSKSTLQFLIDPPESSQGGAVSNGKLFKAAIDLREQSHTREEAFKLLEKAAEKFGGLTDNCIKTINGVYDRDVKYAPRGVSNMFNFRHPTEISNTSEDIEWFVQDTMARGAVSILAGAPKSGKSTLTRQLALAAARGGEWLGRKVQKTPVLYLALEEQESMLKKQLTHIGLDENDPIFLHCGRPMPGNVKDNLIAAINHWNAGLVIVDTLLLLSSFTDINNYNEAYAQINPFREIARETGAHVLLIHHTNKSGTMMGSQGLLGAVDCGMTLSMILGESKQRKLDSLQRGGRPFSNCVLEYNNECDIYTKSSVQGEGI